MNKVIKNNDNKYDLQICQTLYSKLNWSKQIERENNNPNHDFRACCTTPVRSKINRIGRCPIVSDNRSVKPCKGVIIWMSGFQPVERDDAIFTGRCPVLLNKRLSALKYSATTNTKIKVQTK